MLPSREYTEGRDDGVREIVRVFLVDHSPIFIEAFAFLCREEPGVTLVGFSEEGRNALPEILRAKPDVVFVDAQLPSVNSLHLVRAIKEACATTTVIVLSLFASPELSGRAIASGASAFLVKGSFEEILATLHRLSPEHNHGPSPHSTRDSRGKI
jgi:DNA-binding NarL/FixJ family response regulator